MTAVRNTEALLADLPIESIQVSTNNPRRQFDPAALDELKRSIAETGLQVPLLVRPIHPEINLPDELTYELVAGERRLRAVDALGWQKVSCLVREMTDEEARDARIVENLQRADVEPVEEAQAFRDLLESLGSEAAVAARLGKEQSYVAKILRLMALTLPSQDALRARLITIDHALLLARLAEAEQNAALKWCLDPNAGVKTTVLEVVADRIGVRIKEAEKEEGEGRYYRHKWEPASTVRLKSWIEAESGILLSRAPWDLDDAALVPEAGPCTTCPKNTKANAPLFGDLEMGAATCTDGACFAEKTAALVRIRLRTAEPEAVFPPVRLSWKSTSVKPSIVPREANAPGGSCAETANPAKVLKLGQWVEAKVGSCTNVRKGVTVDWSDGGDRGYMGGAKKLRLPGEVLSVCIAVGCKAHKKEWEKPKASGNQDAAAIAANKAQREEEDKRQADYVAAEMPVRLAVYAAVRAKLKPGLKWMRALLVQTVPDWQAVNLCAVLGVTFPKKAGEEGWQLREKAKAALKVHIGNVADEELEKIAWDFQAVQAMRVDATKHKRVKDDRADLWKIAASCKVDADAIAAKLDPAKPVAAKKIAAPSVKKAKAKKPTLTPDRRKAIADAMKKRWAARKTAPAAKKAVKK